MGRNPPNDINVVVEIPKGSDIKYEIDKEIGILRIDRKLSPSMVYPGNYGFIPQTLSGDGDAADVLVIGEITVLPVTVLNSRPIGLLITEDDKGEDSKIISVPSSVIDPTVSHVRDIVDIQPYVRHQLEHFFQHHKDLEKGKFVKILGWKNRIDAIRLVTESMNRYQMNH